MSAAGRAGSCEAVPASAAPGTPAARAASAPTRRAPLRCAPACEGSRSRPPRTAGDAVRSCAAARRILPASSPAQCGFRRCDGRRLRAVPSGQTVAGVDGPEKGHKDVPVHVVVGLAPRREKRVRRIGRPFDPDTGGFVHLISPIVCACGRTHADSAALGKRGWRPDGAGNALLLCQCVCGSILAVASAVDATVCGTCKRLLTGTNEDIKICIERDRIVVCAACFRRDARVPQWLSWTAGAPRAPVTAGPRKRPRVPT